MTAASQGVRVLVVDDNKVAVETLANWLSGSGCEVRAAYDSSAIEIAREFLPDVVLLDINLPGMDGISVAYRLREQEACQDTTIVAITGYDDALYRLMAQEAGIDHYLVKPIDTDALQRLLKLKCEQQRTALDRADVCGLLTRANRSRKIKGPR